MSAVIEKMRFGKYKVRIRRRGAGKAGRFDLPYGAPWLLEHKEPGDLWRSLFGGFNTSTSARWQRYTVWGGPRPGPNA